MSKKPRKTSRKFNYQPKAQAPKLTKVKTNWDLKHLYYTSLKDPEIERDLRKVERAYKKFVATWTTKKFTRNTSVLKRALTEYEKLLGLPERSRIGRYLQLRLALNTNDSEASKYQAQLSNRMRPLRDSILFFTLQLGQLPKKQQTVYLRSQELSHFRYFLEQVFLGAEHDLSEAEEKIINLKSRQSYGMWVNAVDKIVSNRTVAFKGKSIPVPEALETIDTLSFTDKPKLWTTLMNEMEQIGEVAEHEFNAIITDVRTEEKLRGYKKPYSSTALAYEDSEQGIENLVESVSTEGFRLSKKFYCLKAQYHGLSKLPYACKYQSIGEAPAIDFAQAATIARDVFYSVKTEYGEIFDQMLMRGQIDVYPKAGKTGGAFMANTTGSPTMVMLNHTDTFKSLETLAHEMGHAIHSERSKHLSPLYEGHSITTAETASTLFENLLFDAVYEQATESEQLVLLHDRIARDIATIQRQIACFNCELEYHTTIEQEGAMTNQELAHVMYKHLKAYTGSGIDLQPRDGYSYVYWSHLRYGFYVYTYTFGILMSTIMANNYKADPTYVGVIDQFLSAGQSANVAEIFKAIGIDITQKNTFSEALKNHAIDIATFEKLVKAKQS